MASIHAVSGKFIYLLAVILYFIEIIFIDVHMLSPLPLMGSSRTSGGLFRGHARGNLPNHADLSTVNKNFEGSVKGEVYLYLTDQYPRNVKFEFLRGDSELVVIVNVVDSMAPILDTVAKKFAIIRSAYSLFLFTYLF